MSVFGKVEGQTFLITGGASGLGAGYVESFLKDGAKSMAILDISEQAGKAFAEKLNKTYPGKAIFIKCDIGDEESVTKAFNEVVNKFKTIDVIINNAGIMNDSPNIWRKSIDVNYSGLVSLTLKGIKHMNKEEGGKGGTILNIASIAAFLLNPPIPIYAGSKAAVLHFTHSIALGLREENGLRIMTMCFGATNTPLLHNMEKLAYNPKFGQALEAAATDDHVIQKADSAIKGVVDAIKKGQHKTVWLATDDKPVQDITPLIDSVYDTIQKTLYPTIKGF